MDTLDRLKTFYGTLAKVCEGLHWNLPNIYAAFEAMLIYSYYY